MLPRGSIAALLFAFSLGLAAAATAQTTTGIISGIVVDAQSGVLPGVTVTARNTDTGVVRIVVTEGDGRFRLRTEQFRGWRGLARGPGWRAVRDRRLRHR